MGVNYIAILAATLVPLALGFIWYNPKIGFGNAWMRTSGMTPEKAKSMNMAVLLGVSALLALFFAFGVQSIVVHQNHLMSILMTQPDFREAGSQSSEMYKQVMDQYGHSYRTFGHGFFHGFLAGIMLALPIVGTNALYEGRGFKYIAINSGYWILSMAFMGGIICGFE
jgi:hypothetical protein